MFEVVSSGAEGSKLIEARGQDMLAGDFKLKGGLGLKDVGLTLDSAERLEVMLPMSALYRQLMLQAFYSGLFGQDGTVVMGIYEQLASINRKYKESFTRSKARNRFSNEKWMTHREHGFPSRPSF